MKKVVIFILLLALGAGGAFVFLNLGRGVAQPAASTSHDGYDHAGHDHAALPVDVAAGDCAQHGISASLCAFCDPSLVEKLGFCTGHDVPEALCTRCTPALIPAFQIENDWCAEHSLPESQCALCKGAAG